MKRIEPEHQCHARFSDSTTQDFPIRWIRADSLDRAGLYRRAAKKVWFGVCGFSHRIFRTAYLGPLDLILFNDLYIVKGECEESRRCLAQDCPLNKTPDSALKKLLHARREAEVRAVKAFTQKRYCEVFRKKPREGGIILPRG